MLNQLSQVHITTGDGKMEGIPSINVSSLANEFCKKLSEIKGTVCNKCYSNRYSKMRPNLENKLLLNSELLSERLLMPSELPVLNAKYARFNSFGELINETHYMNLMSIASHNPFTTFGLWTKRADIVMEFPKVENIKYVYSVTKIGNNEPSKAIIDYFDKIFIVHSRESTTTMNCYGKCLSCLLCYSDNKTKIIDERIK
jgi:hypothetical protein